MQKPKVISKELSRKLKVASNNKVEKYSMSGRLKTGGYAAKPISLPKIKILEMKEDQES